jgi:hypothetical protein
MPVIERIPDSHLSRTDRIRGKDIGWMGRGDTKFGALGRKQRARWGPKWTFQWCNFFHFFLLNLFWHVSVINQAKEERREKMNKINNGDGFWCES